jgi:hypothetical protein
MYGDMIELWSVTWYNETENGGDGLAGCVSLYLKHEPTHYICVGTGGAPAPGIDNCFRRMTVYARGTTSSSTEMKYGDIFTLFNADGESWGAAPSTSWYSYLGLGQSGRAGQYHTKFVNRDHDHPPGTPVCYEHNNVELHLSLDRKTWTPVTVYRSLSSAVKSGYLVTNGQTVALARFKLLQPGFDVTDPSVLRNIGGGGVITVRDDVSFLTRPQLELSPFLREKVQTDSTGQRHVSYNDPHRMWSYIKFFMEKYSEANTPREQLKVLCSVVFYKPRRFDDSYFFKLFLCAHELKISALSTFLRWIIHTSLQRCQSRRAIRSIFRIREHGLSSEEESQIQEESMWPDVASDHKSMSNSDSDSVSGDEAGDGMSYSVFIRSRTNRPRERGIMRNLFANLRPASAPVSTQIDPEKECCSGRAHARECTAHGLLFCLSCSSQEPVEDQKQGTGAWIRDSTAYILTNIKDRLFARPSEQFCQDCKLRLECKKQLYPFVQAFPLLALPLD